MDTTNSRLFMNLNRTSRRPLLGVLAALSCFSAVTTLHPTPAAAQGQTIQIGVVDEDKLADGFKKYADAVAAIDKRAQDLDAKIPAREFLSPDEGRPFDALIVKSSLSAAETAQLNDLVKTGTGRRAEYLGLVGKAVRSDQESTRMTTLQGYSTANGPQLRQLSDQLLALVRTQQDATDKEYTGRANDVVADVAREKKLLLIVRKKALIYSSDAVDVTNEVLNRLNK